MKEFKFFDPSFSLSPLQSDSQRKLVTTLNLVITLSQCLISEHAETKIIRVIWIFRYSEFSVTMLWYNHTIFPLLWIMEVEFFFFDMHEAKKKLVEQASDRSSNTWVNSFSDIKALTSWSTESTTIRRVKGGNGTGVSQNCLPFSSVLSVLPLWLLDSMVRLRLTSSCPYQGKPKSPEQSSVVESVFVSRSQGKYEFLSSFASGSEI